MFFRTVIVAAFAAFLAGEVLAAPMPMPMQMRARDLAPLDTIAVYKRQENKAPLLKATKSNGKTISLYRRQKKTTKTTNNTPDTLLQPTKSDGKKITLYRREDDDSVAMYKRQENKAPLLNATKSNGKTISLYRRQKKTAKTTNNTPDTLLQPTKSDGKKITLYRREEAEDGEDFEEEVTNEDLEVDNTEA